MLKRLSLLCGLVAVIGVSLALGIRSEKRNGHASQMYAWAHETLRLVWRDVQAEANRPPWFLFPSHHQGSGVTRGANIDDGSLILLAGFLPEKGGGGGGADHARLIRRDGSEVAGWDLDVLAPHPDDYIHGILLDPDGTITFNLDKRSFSQLTRCGELSFTTPGRFHHSLSRAETGGYWILGENILPRNETPADYLPPHTSEFFRSLTSEELEEHGSAELHDHTVVRMDDSGQAGQEFSLLQLVHKGGLGHLMNMLGVGEQNLVHANSVQELPAALASAFPMFAAGDLLLSLRNIHTLLVVDPRTRQIKWRQTGPWVKQHDARFQPDGTITVFDNKYTMHHTEMPDMYLDSDILRVDPASGEVTPVAGRLVAEEGRFHTPRKGQHQMLPDGDVLVAEAKRGRAVQFSPQGEILWEYINRYDEDRVADLSHAYVYPADYFQVDDWSCPAE